MTPTHYEVLGVSPGAGHDEIKRAYVAEARRVHPDRLGDAVPAERRAAERRMREVNAAWDVLRNPARRAAYDASLRGERPIWERGGQGTPRAPRTTTVNPRTTGAPQPPGMVVPAAHAPWLRFGPIVLLVLVLFGVLVFTAYANQQQNVLPSVSTQVTADPATGGVPFAVGDCIYLASVAGRVLPVAAPSCTSPGAQRVVALTDLGRPCAAGQSTFDLPDEKVRLCLGS